MCPDSGRVVTYPDVLFLAFVAVRQFWLAADQVENWLVYFAPLLVHPLFPVTSAELRNDA